jgi:hypothetical protein
VSEEDFLSTASKASSGIPCLLSSIASFKFNPVLLMRHGREWHIRKLTISLLKYETELVSS